MAQHTDNSLSTLSPSYPTNHVARIPHSTALKRHHPPPIQGEQQIYTPGSNHSINSSTAQPAQYPAESDKKNLGRPLRSRLTVETKRTRKIVRPLLGRILLDLPLRISSTFPNVQCRIPYTPTRHPPPCLWSYPRPIFGYVLLIPSPPTHKEQERRLRNRILRCAEGSFEDDAIVRQYSFSVAKVQRGTGNLRDRCGMCLL
jgi:hypothetical protein